MTESKHTSFAVSLSGLGTLLVVLLLALSALLWAMHQHRFQEQQRYLKQHAMDAQASIERHLKANQEYLQLLAEQMADATLHGADFQERTAKYVEDHPELVNVTWADSDFVIRWTAPYEPNQQVVGLQLLLPEPKRASQLASQTKQPVYTPPFILIQGQVAFELYVPVFRGSEFLGTFGGIYAIHHVLQHTLPPTLLRDYQVSVVDARDTLVAQSKKTRSIDTRLVFDLSLEAPGHGLKLRLARYRDQGSVLVNSLFLLMALLVGGLVWASWMYKRRNVQRVAMEAALRESEARFRSMFDHSLDAMFLTRPDGQVLDANATACQLLGRTVAEIQQVGWAGIIDPTDPRHAAMPEVRAQTGAIRAEGRYRRRDGSMFNGELSSALFTAASGEERSVIVLRDITERIQSEEALRRQAERLHLLTDALPVLVAYVDAHSHYQFVNQTYETWFGLSRQAIIGQHVAEVIGADAYRAVSPHLAVALDGQSVTFESVVSFPDGRERVVHADYVPHVEGTGDVLGVYTLVRDMTERQQAEEALRQSEEQFRALAEGSIQGISIDRDLKPLFMNQAAADILGYESPDEILQMDTLLPLIPPEHREQLQHTSRARLAGEPVPNQYEMQAVRKDGTRIWLDIKLQVVQWDHAPAIQVTLFDITERKRLEAELRHVQKMESLDTLAGGIAHEFNNILAAMLGFTEMATFDLPPSHPVASHLQHVLIAGGRAKDLVQQMLTFSRHSDLDRQPVQLSRLLHESLPLLHASLPSTMTIRLHITEEATTVQADPTQLHQILLNLCANAEYAMRETGGVLDIELDVVEVHGALSVRHPTLPPGPYVRFTVRDTGPGIPPELVDRIFEPFFTTKGVGEGTGMGLAIVHGIVTTYGGAMTVESTPGAGTVFVIYLPRCDAAISGETPVAPEADILSGQGCILFVDDEEMLTRVAQGCLAHLGYDVVAYLSSVEALEAFQAEPDRFDLVITDQTMPEMTGETLARALRGIRPEIPIILCTGFSHLINAEKAQALGIDAFLTKPLDWQKLARIAQHILEHHESSEEGFTSLDS